MTAEQIIANIRQRPHAAFRADVDFLLSHVDALTTRLSEQEVELERRRLALGAVQAYFEAGGYATLDGATLGVIGVVNHALTPTTEGSEQ